MLSRPLRLLKGLIKLNPLECIPSTGVETLDASTKHEELRGQAKARVETFTPNFLPVCLLLLQKRVV